jgi:DNA repair protein RadC
MMRAPSRHGETVRLLVEWFTLEGHDRPSAARRARATASALLPMGGLSSATLACLIDNARLGEGEARRLRCAVQLGRGAFADVESTRARMNRPDDVYAWARPRLAHLDHEELWALALDCRCRLKAARRITRGGLSEIHVRVRDVLRVVLGEGASMFVLVHNHPSGDPSPSREDREVTRELHEAATLIDTPLVDHLVVARHGYERVPW